MITLSQIKEAKKKVLKKHKTELSISNIKPSKKIAKFIQACFKEDYGDEGIMKFTAEIISDIEPTISFAAYKGKKMVGVFVGIPYEGSVLCTGLSVPKEERGQGIAQLLWLTQMENMVGKYDSSIYWLDSRHNWGGSSHSTFSKNPTTAEIVKPVSIFGKSLDSHKAAKATKLNFAEKAWIKIANAIFPQKPGAIKKEKGFWKSNMRLTDGKNSVYGFVNPTPTGSYFQVDRIELYGGYFENRNFLSICENQIKEMDCYSIIFPTTVTRTKMVKYGYFPFLKQALAINRYKEKYPELMPLR